jgi:deoxyribose-phosphate aldolase
MEAIRKMESSQIIENNGFGISEHPQRQKGCVMEHINQYIDQTILRPEATRADIVHFLEGVKKYCFYAACVHPCWVELARKYLPESIKVCSVVGFPLGADSTRVKAYAAQDLVATGCDEIDMVMNIGKFKGMDYSYVSQEIQSIVDAVQGRVVKVIIEACLLNKKEKETAARIIRESGAHFVKTSTGFSEKGAQIDDVRLLRAIVGPDFGIKASGGIRDFTAAVKFIQAGANRLGTSAGIEIVENR